MHVSPGVSIIIPAYNYGQFVGLAIESVLAQKYPYFELIVVDDGSTDDTGKVIAGFTDPRVCYIRQENAGLSAARNTGIRNARFPFVAFLDADDEWLPDFLETVMRTFEKIGDDFALVASGSDRVNAIGNPLTKKNFTSIYDFELTARDIIVRTRFMPSAVVVRRTIFDECGFFDTTLRSSEDRDMWIRIAVRSRVFFVCKILVRIRKHDTNMSRNAERMKRSMRRVIAKAFRARVVPAWDFPFWLRVLAVHFFQIAWTHYDEGRRLDAIRYVLTSMLLWPLFVRQRKLNEPWFFRARALARFVLRKSGTACAVSS